MCGNCLSLGHAGDQLPALLSIHNAVGPWTIELAADAVVEWIEDADGRRVEARVTSPAHFPTWLGIVPETVLASPQKTLHLFFMLPELEKHPGEKLLVDDLI